MRVSAPTSGDPADLTLPLARMGTGRRSPWNGPRLSSTVPSAFTDGTFL
jgi:hypothetical protein